MASKDRLRPEDIGKNLDRQMVQLKPETFLPLPAPYDTMDLEPGIKPMSEAQQEKFECGLDGVSAIMLPKPQTEEE